ncbi:hypothetical protein JTB14_020562 [Gonioctena quinquepunctata]|nr:hypothetical protein JTB14_020562 [Gonioctena quinquepunctata]
MEQNRLQIPKTQIYRNSTIRIGNWFENQLSYEKGKFRHISEYSKEFQKKPHTTHSPTVLWDARIKAEGHGFYPEKANEESPNFYDNFSTTYDLSYKYFPTVCREHIYRVHRPRVHRHDPTEEYLKSYGNITNYGLTQQKQKEWECDKQDPRTTSYTMYKIEFTPQEKDSYKSTRWARPTAVKGEFGLVHKPLVANHPRSSKCNPITWECKDDLYQKSF